MSVFADYARYYDLLYKDKNYRKEADYVHQQIQNHFPGANSILELGCGTGAHGRELVEMGYELHGVDLSLEMLEAAQKRRAEMHPEQANKLTFSQGDACSIRIARKFDVVLSLFHVMSYQLTNNKLLSAFATAKAHLRPGGIFLFDCWYGPAVLTEKPSVRIKRLGDETISVTRIAEPVMHYQENCVDVNYQLIINEKSSDAFQVIEETHRIRYIFKPEMEYFLEQNGFNVFECSEWMTGKEPGADTWNVLCVAKA